jgi:RNA polymerase sigma-70 factor (ECF subfamily)
MNREDLDRRLSQIATSWTVLRAAHEGPEGEAAAARQLLLERYGPAARSYLRRALGDAHASDDLFQEFALALVRGAFRGADPRRRRFRHYLKTVLLNLVRRHHRRQKRRPQTRDPVGPELAGLAAAPADPKAEFDEDWRRQLLARAWDALAQSQPTFHAVLRFRADHPKMRSPEMAEELGRRLGKPLTPDGLRQTLHRARDRFADLLLDEIAHSLEAPTLEQVEEELAELNLLEYCRPALAQRRRGAE